MFGLKGTLFGGTALPRREPSEGNWGARNAAAPGGQAAGLIAGTLIATAMGWRPAEGIVAGDLVLTFDRGLQPVRKVVRAKHWDASERCPRALWPLAVPAGALGNETPLLVLPEQSVLVESDSADALFGDPFSLLMARDLEGFRGIARVMPGPHLDVIQLCFEADEVVFAQSGALMHCPSARSVQVAALLDAARAPAYCPLSPDEAELLIDCLVEEDAVSGGADLTPHAEDAYAAALA